MDPLSITLAVITFATAVKDLVELAQAIRDTFAKVPQNYKKAFDLASDILRTSKQIQTLYVSKKDILDSAEDLKECLQDLTQEMLLVRNECVHLIPPVSDKIQERVKISLYFFWNRNRVEDLVSGLKSHVDSCYRNFLLLSSIRTEATVNQISRIVGGIAVQVQSEIVPRLPDAQPLCQFSQSCSTSMERIEQTVSDKDIYKLVLRREVGRIKKLLGRLTSDWHANPLKKRVPPLNATWGLHRPPLSDTIAHQNLIVNAFQLQSAIGMADIIKINTGVHNFSCGLAKLGMPEDSLTITLWAVESWKKIISLSPANDLNAWACLANHLTNASVFYNDIGDMDKAYAKSQEAIDIIQEKLDHNSVSPEAQKLMAENLCNQARNTCSPLQNNIELATRAVLTMEGALRLHKFQKKPLSIDTQLVSSRTSLYLMARSALRVDYIRSKLFSRSLHDSLYSYSEILVNLSNVQKVGGYISEAHATRKHALVILHSLLLEYPNSERLLEKTASVVLDLCNSTFRNFNSLVENLAYAEEGTDKYRKLLRTNHSAYIIRLLNALQSYREIFFSVGMVQESERIIREMIVLSELPLGDNVAERDKEIRYPANFDEHLPLIDCLMEALAGSEPDPSSVEKASELIALFKKLFLSLDKFDFKSRAPGLYMEVLDKNGLVDNAIDYGQGFLSAWERKHTYSNSNYTAHSYLFCMKTHIHILEKHDRTHDALKYTTSVMAQCSQRHRYFIIHTIQLWITKIHIELLCSMGFYEAALQCAQAVSVNCCSAQDTPRDWVCTLFKLLNLARMQLYNYLPLQAIETAGQAELLARSKICKNQTGSFDIFLVPNLNHSTYTLSVALFDAAQTSESLAHLSEWKGTQGIIDSDGKSNATVYNNRVSGTLARIFFVQSDYAQAEQLMVKVVEMDRKLFEEKKFYLVELAFDILFSAITFCCVNEHEAGVASLAELDDLQRRCSVTHPALARWVEFNLVMQVRRGQWKLIQTAARAKLTCNHVDQALDLNMACLDNTGLEVAELEQ